MIFRLLPRSVVTLAMILILTLLPFPATAGSSGTGNPGAKSGSANERVDSGGIGGWLLAEASDRIQQLTEQLSEAGRSLLMVPALPGDVAAKAHDPGILMTWGEMAGKVLLVLVAGFLA